MILAYPPLALAVDKELGGGIVGVAVYGRHLALSSRPCPVGQQVERMVVPVPHGAVEPVAVLGQPCEIEDAEVAAPRGPVAVVRRRFAEVVEARPDKLPDGPGIVVLHHKVVVGQIAPRTVVDVVAVALPAGAVHRVVGHGGEVVDTARTETRGCRAL